MTELMKLKEIVNLFPDDFFSKEFLQVKGCKEIIIARAELSKLVNLLSYQGLNKYSQSDDLEELSSIQSSIMKGALMTYKRESSSFHKMTLLAWFSLCGELGLDASKLRYEFIKIEHRINGENNRGLKEIPKNLEGRKPRDLEDSLKSKNEFYRVKNGSVESRLPIQKFSIGLKEKIDLIYDFYSNEFSNSDNRSFENFYNKVIKDLKLDISYSYLGTICSENRKIGKEMIFARAKKRERKTNQLNRRY